METQLKVLIAEDNEINMETMREFFSYAEFDVIEAVNGKDAVEKATQHLPHVILMDIQMPVMNGFDATRILKNQNETKHIPVIALTALAMPGDKEKCIDAGVDDYISKPFNFSELQQKIKLLTMKR